MSEELEPCPLCGGGFKYCHETYITSFGDEVTRIYYMHEPPEGARCVLDEICMPFVIGAGDERKDEGYLGEYPELWNTRYERTCNNVAGKEGTNQEYYDFCCSKCGFCCCLPEPSFCPGCGSKVDG